jgi:hypothetical protein
MYAYAAFGGTHTYKYIAQSTAALGQKIFIHLLPKRRLCNRLMGIFSDWLGLMKF